MDDTTAELTERFERYCSTTSSTPSSTVPEDVLNELQSMIRLYSISPEELDFKWQAYSMKIGEDSKLDAKTARDFKKSIQDTLERESRGKAQQRGNEGKRGGPNPRAGGKGGDMYDMLEGLVPNTPRPSAVNGANGSTVKRKSHFDTPASKASKSYEMSSPSGALTPRGDTNSAPIFDFSSREHVGDITEQLNNADISLPDPPEEPPAEARIKLKANTDMSKFSYRTMAMKLTDAAEMLDDRIDEFLKLFQDSTGLEDGEFGNPTHQSPNEIIAVGRIACDSPQGKLNTKSLVLEGSRRWGSGRRVHLDVDSLTSYDFFPGQIVAVKGTNPSGSVFKVLELLSLPLLGQPATKPDELTAFNARYLDTPESDPENPRPMNIFIASGPYTTDQNLDFSPLYTLLDNAATSFADAVILLGPFLDAEHPAIRTGDFDIPPNVSNPDQATMSDLFRHYISSALQSFHKRLPTCTIILCPSLRDATSKHAAWPQDKLVKADLGLGPAGKMVRCVTNPMTLAMNEITFGMSSIDILDMLRREELVGGQARGTNSYERGARNVLEQRNFLPVFPPTERSKLLKPAEVEEKLFLGGQKNSSSSAEGGEAKANADSKKEEQEQQQEPLEEEEEEGPSPFLPLGTMLDTSYLKLGEMLNVRPDVLITPSVLQGCVKVVESVLMINPGTLAKRRAAGTYARMVINPANVTDEERERGFAVAHKLWERARVDIVKI